MYRLSRYGGIVENNPQRQTAPRTGATSPAAMTPRIDVLHVPFTYFPEAAGGTEVYVAALATALESSGFGVAIAAPGATNLRYRHEDLRVFRFAGQAGPTLEHAYGSPDRAAADAFACLLHEIQPRIVHLHAHTAAVSHHLARDAKQHGAKVVFTYHTPTATCVRGTMMRRGLQACDGVLDVRRCTACVLEQHMPRALANVIATSPQALGRTLAELKLAGGAFTALRMSDLIARQHCRFRNLIRATDHVIAVCHWVAEVLRSNGVPDAKLTICRQGVRPPRLDAAPRRAASRDESAALRIGYFGRLNVTKGVDVLVDALKLVPHAPVELEIYAIPETSGREYVDRVVAAASRDPRITIKSAVAPETVLEHMRECDLVAVPSRWLETGPLVVLEAFGAGTPVIGSNLGGIAELVTKDIDGVLVPPGVAQDWANALTALARNRTRVAELKRGVRPPRTMNEVASEMSAVYGRVLRNRT